MAQCPVCQNEVESGFGMIMCPQCQTPLFFDFEGNIQTSSSGSELNLDTNISANANLHSDVSNEILSEISTEESNYSQDIQDSQDQEYSGSEHDNAAPVDSYDLALSHDAVMITEEPNSEHVQESDIQNPNHLLKKTSRELTEDDFHEKGSTIPTKGLMLYTLTIEGIDGSRLRSELYEELKDPRWGWVALEIFEKVNQGKLVLKNVNAVKASLLVNRLKHLALQIFWKQQVGPE